MNSYRDLLVSKADAVRDALYSAINYVPSVKYSTEKLITAIEHVSGFQVQTLVVDMERSDLRGMLLVFESTDAFSMWLEDNSGYKSQLKPINDQAEGVGLVLLSSKCNPCWQRFTVIKEASHLLFEAEDLLESTDILELAKAVVEIPEPGKEDGNAELFYRDYSGIVAALELLMPEAIRINVTHWVNVDKQTPYQVAEKLRIPEKFVEIRLDEWGL
ncbi:MAG: hypothetical protein K6L74_16030 [Neptuniibacter sp.]